MKTSGRIVVLLSFLFLAAPAVAGWPWTPRPPVAPLTITPAEPSADVIADESTCIIGPTGYSLAPPSRT